MVSETPLLSLPVACPGREHCPADELPPDDHRSGSGPGATDHLLSTLLKVSGSVVVTPKFRVEVTIK